MEYNLSIKINLIFIFFLRKIKTFIPDIFCIRCKLISGNIFIFQDKYGVTCYTKPCYKVCQTIWFYNIYNHLMILQNFYHDMVFVNFVLHSQVYLVPINHSNFEGIPWSSDLHSWLQECRNLNTLWDQFEIVSDFTQLTAKEVFAQLVAMARQITCHRIIIYRWWLNMCRGHETCSRFLLKTINQRCWDHLSLKNPVLIIIWI